MSVVKTALSAEALGCLDKLKSLNLWPIAAYLMDSKKGCGWTLPQAFRAIGRYKTFLFVSYLYPEVLLVPTEEIDRVWHVHILHTRQYRGDCEMLFGRFIDHEPDSELWGESHQPHFDEAFAQTQALLALFERYFIQADSGETQLHQADTSESTENQPQLGSEGDKGNLLLCPSACGRPGLAGIASIFWKDA
jgi:hypothetical protein